MPNFSAKDVMDLRGRTGCGMMDCKKALIACEGDIEKAIDYLREKGLAKAAKKQSRIAAEGIVGSYICSKCGAGALVEVNCETDFVANTPEFKEMVNGIAQQIVRGNPADVDALMAEKYLDTEKKIMMVQMENDPKMAGKPEQVREKIVMGKLNKFYSENCLLQQEFVKDGDFTVEKYIAAAAKALGGKVTFVDAIRFEKGEGIEKKEENFAAEIASMVKG